MSFEVCWSQAVYQSQSDPERLLTVVGYHNGGKSIWVRDRNGCLGAIGVGVFHDNYKWIGEFYATD